MTTTPEHHDLEHQIIETAQQLFIEKGFAETSMSDIAATVGINRPTLHYYFRTKEKMFKAVFGTIINSLMPKIQEIIARQDVPFMNRLETILDVYIELFTQNPCLPRFICGEIQRDVSHLLDVARELQLNVTLSQVRQCLEAEMAAGKLKRVAMPIVFLTAYSFLTYPFLAKNLVQSLLLDEGTAFDDFLQDWKQHIMSQMRYMLCC